MWQVVISGCLCFYLRQLWAKALEMSLLVNHSNYLATVLEDSGKHRYQELLLYSPLDKTLASCSNLCLFPASWTLTQALEGEGEAGSKWLSRQGETASYSLCRLLHENSSPELYLPEFMPLYRPFPHRLWTRSSLGFVQWDT